MWNGPGKQMQRARTSLAWGCIALWVLALGCCKHLSAMGVPARRPWRVAWGAKGISPAPRFYLVGIWPIPPSCFPCGIPAIGVTWWAHSRYGSFLVSNVVLFWKMVILTVIKLNRKVLAGHWWSWFVDPTRLLSYTCANFGLGSFCRLVRHYMLFAGPLFRNSCVCGTSVRSCVVSSGKGIHAWGWCCCATRCCVGISLYAP